MKLKHLIIVSLILAIITIGAVSASQDSDVVTVDEETGVDEIAQAPDDDVEVIAGDDEDDESPKELSADDFFSYYEKSVANNYDEYVFYVNNYAEYDEGNLTVNVGDSEIPIYNQKFEYNTRSEFNLTDLGITSLGNYKILVKFVPTVKDEITLIDYTLKVTENEYHDQIDANIMDYVIVNPISDEYDYIVEFYSQDDFDGNILIYIDDEEKPYYTGTINKDIIYITDLNNKVAIGDRFVQVKYEDGENTILLASKIISFDYIIGVLDYYGDNEARISVGSSEDLTIYLPNDATGDLYLTFNGKETKLDYKDGAAKYTIVSDDLIIGELYPLSIELRNDELYPLKTYQRNVETYFDVIYPDEMSVGEHETISTNLPSTYSGVITVYLLNSEDEKTLIGSANVVNGQASVSLDKLTEGDQELLVEYNNGTETFKAYADITVRKNNETVSAIVQPQTIEVGNSVTLKITGPKTLNQKFMIYVDGNKETELNLYDLGEVTYSVKFNTVGDHTIKVYASDDNDYEDLGWVFFSNTFTINVKEKQADTPVSQPVKPTPKPADKITLTLKKVTVKKSAKKLVLQATLKVNKKAKKGLKVTFKFNGKKYTARTTAKGIAKVTLSKKVLKKLKVGKKVKYQVSYGKTVKKLTVKVKK